jgi:hypothetical protein
MTVTPKISLSGIEDALGGSACRMNLLIPTGTGPTRISSRTWSWDVDFADPTYTTFHSRSVMMLGKDGIGLM